MGSSGEQWGSHHSPKLPLVESEPNTGQGWRCPMGMPQSYPGEMENLPRSGGDISEERS